MSSEVGRRMTQLSHCSRPFGERLDSSFVNRAQPLERRRRFVLVLVDRRVAEDREHLFSMRSGLWLQREAASLDDAHASSKSSRELHAKAACVVFRIVGIEALAVRYVHSHER